MFKETAWTCSILLLFACLVNSQSCPPNTAMGLCESVPQPCFGDSDCSNGEICCPQACSRSCKPRNTRRVSVDVSVPDLLNDPRVYVGKCPHASCYNVFGGEENECSTSNLCPGGQFCCNDGCRNVCKLTPEYAARIAQEETRIKTQQQIILQKQQEEMMRRQQEMYVQRQRQLATAERARQQAEARAAAEAELAAQHVRAKYEAGLRAVAQSNAVAALQQRMANLKVSQNMPQQKPPSSTQSSPSSGSFLDNFVGEQQYVNSVNTGSSNLDQPQPQPSKPARIPESRGYFSPSKRDNLAESLINQINSPANANPYNLPPEQNVNGKSTTNELLSLIQTPQSNSAAHYPTNTNKIMSGFPFERISANNAARNVAKTIPSQQSSYLYSSQKVPLGYQALALSSPYGAKSAQPMHPLEKYPSQPIVDRTYQSLQQLETQSPYREQAGQGPVDPFLMYHAMQTAA